MQTIKWVIVPVRQPIIDHSTDVRCRFAGTFACLLPDDRTAVAVGDYKGIVMMNLTGRLVAAGRALAGISAEDLGASTGIKLGRFRYLEASGAAWISPEESEVLIQALERFGIVIIGESDGFGAGVRLKFTRQDVRQIARLETEGGVANSDDVP